MDKAVFFDCFGVLYQGGDRNQHILDFAQTLRSKGYKVGVLSNSSPGVFERLFAPGEREELFDAVIVSSEVGLGKPQPEIFYLACQRLGVKPEQAIHVDDVDTYCDAAKAVGMQAVLYESNQQAMADITDLLGETDA